jgi:cyclophilin family peptidyl-prolyl cis-trans isomerase
MTYVNGGRYDGSIMHRLARNFVIQGGGFYPEFISEPPPVNVSLDPTAIVDRDGNPSTPNPTVTNEYSVGTIRSNLTGTISMARQSGLPNSATNQWFVNLANNAGLDSVDGGFTVFARVVGDGMVLYNAFNGLAIANLNPDTDDNGIRNAGPFGTSATDGVPYLPSGSSDILVVLEKARRIDYLGNGLTTAVPAGGLTFSARDAFIDTGTVFTGAATNYLRIGAGRTLGIREGYSLNRSLENHGTLAPGLQLGSITVQGNYFQYTDGALDIQLRETVADTEHDRLVVTGEAYLGGEMHVSLLSGFVPTAGDSFTVLSASLIISDFLGIELPMLNQGLVWDVSKTLTSYTLSVAAADFNRDGIVDTADYVVWRKGRNTTVPAYTGADGNGDGLVNDADLTIWRANLGNVRGTASGGGAGSGLVGVPEPSTAGLIVLGAAMLLAGNRRFSSMNRRRSQL